MADEDRAHAALVTRVQQWGDNLAEALGRRYPTMEEVVGAAIAAIHDREHVRHALLTVRADNDALYRERELADTPAPPPAPTAKTSEFDPQQSEVLGSGRLDRAGRKLAHRAATPPREEPPSEGARAEPTEAELWGIAASVPDDCDFLEVLSGMLTDVTPDAKVRLSRIAARLRTTDH